MKKLFNCVGILPFVALGFIAFLSCKQLSSEQKITEKEMKSDTTSSLSGENSELKSFMTASGAGIDSTKAGLYTREYYSSLVQSTLPASAKSIYFEMETLEDFMQSIEDAQLCGGTIGFRFYLAKYPANDANNPFRGQHTVIMRATCDGEDIPHQINSNQTETTYVAFNFGDVCPPRCKLDDPDQTYTDGRYQTRSNCAGCPVRQ